MKMQRKGAVPIPYIIALVLAIAVIAIIVYWLFFSSGDFGNIILEKECDAVLMAYCAEYKASASYPPFSTACTSINENNQDNYYATQCCSFNKFQGSVSNLC